MRHKTPRAERPRAQPRRHHRASSPSPSASESESWVTSSTYSSCESSHRGSYGRHRSRRRARSVSSSSWTQSSRSWSSESDQAPRARARRSRSSCSRTAGGADRAAHSSRSARWSKYYPQQQQQTPWHLQGQRGPAQFASQCHEPWGCTPPPPPSRGFPAVHFGVSEVSAKAAYHPCGSSHFPCPPPMERLGEHHRYPMMYNMHQPHQLQPMDVGCGCRCGAVPSAPVVPNYGFHPSHAGCQAMGCMGGHCACMRQPPPPPLPCRHCAFQAEQCMWSGEPPFREAGCSHHSCGRGRVEIPPQWSQCRGCSNDVRQFSRSPPAAHRSPHRKEAVTSRQEDAGTGSTQPAPYDARRKAIERQRIIARLEGMEANRLQRRSCQAALQIQSWWRGHRARWAAEWLRAQRRRFRPPAVARPGSAVGLWQRRPQRQTLSMPAWQGREVLSEAALDAPSARKEPAVPRQGAGSASCQSEPAAGNATRSAAGSVSVSSEVGTARRSSSVNNGAGALPRSLTRDGAIGSRSHSTVPAACPPSGTGPAFLVPGDGGGGSVPRMPRGHPSQSARGKIDFEGYKSAQGVPSLVSSTRASSARSGLEVANNGNDLEARLREAGERLRSETLARWRSEGQWPDRMETLSRVIRAA
mmetsp:Transcript_7920/g.17529  ORF Transcript_7920/g.17529 Transcript_7920/m.17529 type:complete len:641 (-) Transcript_7920:69-1991(-)